MKNEVKINSKEEQISSIKKLIDMENQSYESYEECLRQCEDERERYQNEYDYEYDPNGDFFDLNYVHCLTIEIEKYERYLEESLQNLNRYEIDLSILDSVPV
jgi:hypothetical protein